MDYIINEKVLIVPEGTVKIGFRDICDYIYDHQIEEILLPSTLEIIEDDTFFDFTEIKKINIPPCVKEIGSQAFWGLDDVKELVVPSTVERVKKYAFVNLRGKLIILSESERIPDGWDSEFAASVNEICFMPPFAADGREI